MGRQGAVPGLGRITEAAAEDIDTVYARNVMRLGKHYKGDDMVASKAVNGASGADEEEEEDFSLYEQQGDQVAAARRQITRALKDEQRYERTVQRCACCKPSPYDLHVGTYFTLRLKAQSLRLAPSHCELLPRAHVESTLRLDDDAHRELASIKSAVRAMHAAEGSGATCFAESAVEFSSMPHVCVDCVPVERGMEAEIRYSYREALTDINTEWAQNSKIHELVADRPLRRALPHHVEYVSCEWAAPTAAAAAAKNGEQPKQPVVGLAAVVSVEGGGERVRPDFSLDVLAGVLGEDPMRMRKGRPVDARLDVEEVSRIRAMWARCCA